MQAIQPLCRLMAAPLAVIFFLACLPLDAANAGLVSTDRVLAQQNADAERTRIQDFLEREDVRSQLEAFGVDPSEAAKRVNSLSDEEIHQIAGKIDTLPAGEGALEALLIAAAVIFLILILTDLLGVTDVFPFIKPARVR